MPMTENIHTVHLLMLCQMNTNNTNLASIFSHALITMIGYFVFHLQGVET